MTRILITSALPYINGIKHLGNLAGSMLPADVFARFQRKHNDDEVLFICATDEHGTPAELAAAAAGQPVADYCTEQHEIQAKLAERFGISWDWFGRSSSPQNRALTQGLADRLEANGYIQERTDRLFFSVDDNRFLPDRYVEGTCPKCKFPMARGDQCDGCGAQLEPTALLQPRSTISGSTNIELRDTQHLYILQSKLAGRVREWVDERAPNWSPLARGIAYKHLDEGLIDRGITRDLEWGVPVNRPGFENKVFYVWFDAPVEYIAATQERGDDWEKWWLPEKPTDVRYVQVMGKDNVAFHTANFPATLIGAGASYKTVDFLKAFNWLNWYGGKFSTSQNRGVFMDTALDLFPADYWRWYLSINAPEGSDTAFTWPQFQTSVNELADTLGNFVSRTITLALKTPGEWTNELDHTAASSPTEVEANLEAELWAHVVALTRDLDAFEIGKSAKLLRGIWTLGNNYLQATAPWSSLKAGDTARASLRLRTALNLLRVYSVLSEPFIPASAQKLGELFSEGLNVRDVWRGDIDLNAHTSLLTVDKAPILFPKIDPTKLHELETAFE